MKEEREVSRDTDLHAFVYAKKSFKPDIDDLEAAGASMIDCAVREARLFYEPVGEDQVSGTTVEKTC